MGFTREKRKWLVEALGEDRVRELEEQLPLLGKALRAHGVRYKDLAATIGRATSFGEADALLEISNKLDAFSGIVFNITAGDMPPDAKRAAVQQAATDLAARLGATQKASTTPKAGAKVFRDEILLSPAAAYANDLLGKRPTDQKAKVKALRDSKAPASQYLGDLLERGRTVVQGT